MRFETSCATLRAIFIGPHFFAARGGSTFIAGSFARSFARARARADFLFPRNDINAADRENSGDVRAGGDSSAEENRV